MSLSVVRSGSGRNQRSGTGQRFPPKVEPWFPGANSSCFAPGRPQSATPLPSALGQCHHVRFEIVVLVRERLAGAPMPVWISSRIISQSLLSHRARTPAGNPREGH